MPKGDTGRGGAYHDGGRVYFQESEVRPWLPHQDLPSQRRQLNRGQGMVWYGMVWL